MSVPYLHLYVADYLGDTQHLSTEQHGAYLLLLMAMWRSGGAIANDDQMLARITRLSLKKWRGIKAVILSLLVETEGRLSQKRLLSELQKATVKIKNRSAAGHKGGIAKALKYKKPAVANASVLPKQPEPEPEVSEAGNVPLVASENPGKAPVPRSTRRAARDGEAKKVLPTQRTPLPADFPTPEAKQAACKYWRDRHRPDLEARADDQAEQFRDHHRKTAGRMADWPAAWRTWVRNAIEFTKPPNGHANGHGNGSAIEATGLSGWAGRLETFYGMKGSPAGTWLPKWGPRPGENGSVVDEAIYAEFKRQTGVDPRQTRGQA